MFDFQKTVLILLIVAVAFSAKAQQDPQFTQNMHARLLPNPAVAGSNQAICATVLGRYQWVGFDGGNGNPETYLLSVHGPVNLLNQNFGVGLSLTHDQLGNQKNIGAKAALAWRKPMGNGNIGVGVGLGIINVGLQPFTNDDAVDGVGSDPVINTTTASSLGFDMDLGIYYNSDKLYVGFSSTHLTQPDLKSTIVYEISRHYYVTAGYNTQITPDFVLQPSVFVNIQLS